MFDCMHGSSVDALAFFFLCCAGPSAWNDTAQRGSAVHSITISCQKLEKDSEKHLIAMSGIRLEERLAVGVPQLHRLVLAARHAVVPVDVVTDSSHRALESISTYPQNRSTGRESPFGQFY